MKKLTYLPAIIFFAAMLTVKAQVVFVDAMKGNDLGIGSKESPVASIAKAVELTKYFKGNEPVTIKVQQGIYTLTDKIVIDKVLNDSLRFTIEAGTMPDDADWLPTKMPVIQSVSANNSENQFLHAIGFLIATNHVAIKGLKFLGNANPDVKYYYPVTREIETLNGLDISQCYFIGERNSSPIQGSIWAHGAGTHVDHCIFYGCKNALLLFKSIKDFSLTYSIIYGAYESAVWYGPFDSEFIFHNNIVSHCAYLWLRAENTYPAYTFSNSLFTDMEHLMGYYSKNGSIPAEKNSHKEIAVDKSGKLVLSEVSTNGMPKDYLNPTARSDGKVLGAGIFKNP